MTRVKHPAPAASRDDAPNPPPGEDAEQEARIDAMLEQTFPASDPPAWSSLHDHGAAPASPPAPRGPRRRG